MAGVNAGTIHAQLVLDNQNFQQGMSQAQQSMNQLNQTANSTKKAQVDMKAALMGIGVGITAAIGASIMAAARFEQSMAKVKAISGATDQEFAALEQTAKDLGASTAFSATQAADGMALLAAAGFKTNDIISSMPGLLNLAGAAGLDLATSADYLGSIMSGFGIEAKNSGHAVDVLVQAMNDANTDLPDLAEAMKYVAPVASAMKFSIEDTAAAIALMSNYGIKGSQAGTSLRAMLLSMANPVGQAEKAMKKLGISFKDSNGEMKPLPEILDHVKGKMEGLTDAQKTQYAAMLVGTEASSGFLALLNEGGAGLETFADGLRASEGAAADMAATMKDTLVGAWDEFTSAIEGIGIEIGQEFLPEAKAIVQVATDIVQVLSKVNPDLIELGLKLTAGATAGGLLYFALLKLPLAFKAIQLAMGPAGWIMMGLGAIAGAFMHASEKTKENAEVNLDHAKALGEQRKSLEDNVAAYDELAAKNKLSTEEMGRWADIQARLRLATNAKEIAALKDEQAGLAKKSGLSNEQLDKMIELNDTIIEQAPNAASAITSSGKAIMGNTDEAKKYIATLKEAQRLELRKQVNNAEQGLDDSISKMEKAQKSMVTHAKEYKSIKNDILAQESKLAYAEEVLAEKKRTGSSSEIAMAQQQVDAEKNTLKYMNGQLLEEEKIVLKKAEAYNKEQMKVAKAQQAVQELITYHMQQVEVTAEKGKEVEAIQKAIDKQRELLKTTQQKFGEDGKITAEEQKQLDAISKKLGLLEEAGTAVGELKGKQDKFSEAIGKSIEASELLNLDLEKDITKYLETQGFDKKDAEELGKELGKKVTKEVDVKGKKKAEELHKEATKKGEKPVVLKGDEEKIRAYLKAQGSKEVKLDDKGSAKKLDDKATAKKTKEVKVDDKGTVKKLDDKATSKKTKDVKVQDRGTIADLDRKAQAGKTKDVKVKTSNFSSWLHSLTKSESKTVRVVAEKVGAAWNFLTGKRHAGGTLHDLPKYHDGGSPALDLPASFGRMGSAPKFDEVDVRLLRNEMVLTQTQQSNLFRMISSFGHIAEARMKAASKGGSQSVGQTVIQVGSLVVREQADVKRIAEELERLSKQRSRSRGEY